MKARVVSSRGWIGVAEPSPSLPMSAAACRPTLDAAMSCRPRSSLVRSLRAAVTVAAPVEIAIVSRSVEMTSCSRPSVIRVTTRSPEMDLVTFTVGVTSSIRPPSTVLNTRMTALVFRSTSWCTSRSCAAAGATANPNTSAIPPINKRTFIRLSVPLFRHDDDPGIREGSMPPSTGSPEALSIRLPAVGDPEPAFLIQLVHTDPAPTVLPASKVTAWRRLRDGAAATAMSCK